MFHTCKKYIINFIYSWVTMNLNLCSNVIADLHRLRFVILPLSLFFSSQSFLLRLVVYHSLKCRSKGSLRTKASQRGCVNWRDPKSRGTRERYEWRMPRYTSSFSSVHAQCNVRLRSLCDDECKGLSPFLPPWMASSGIPWRHFWSCVISMLCLLPSPSPPPPPGRPSKPLS